MIHESPRWGSIPMRRGRGRTVRHHRDIPECFAIPFQRWDIRQCGGVSRLSRTSDFWPIWAFLRSLRMKARTGRHGCNTPPPTQLSVSHGASSSTESNFTCTAFSMDSFHHIRKEQLAELAIKRSLTTSWRAGANAQLQGADWPKPTSKGSSATGQTRFAALHQSFYRVIWQQ